MGAVDHWPFVGLSVRTPRLTLRYIDDDIATALAELAAAGIHDPAVMPFGIPWTDAPPGELERGALQFYWRTRSTLQPDDWHLTLAVETDGQVVGAQDLMGKEFGRRRGVASGSWLGQHFQGRGIGTEMRAAVLHLAFAGLGAEFAETAAWHDNLASQGVTRKLGYEEIGDEVLLRRDRPTRQLRFRLERAAWEARRRDDIDIVGLEPCLPLLIAG